MKFADFDSESVITQIHQYRNQLPPIDQPHQQRILMIQTQDDGEIPRLIIVSERPEIERRVLVIQENQDDQEINHTPLLMVHEQEQQTPQYQAIQGNQENTEEQRYNEYSACDEKDVEIIPQQPMDCEPPPLPMMTAGSETPVMNPPIFYNTALRTFQVPVSKNMFR